MTLESWVQIATIATPIIAFLGLGGIWLQVEASRKASASSAATQFYTQLLSKGLKYPQFVAPDPTLIKINLSEQTFDGNEIEFRRYEMFVDLMLTTFDQMLLSGESNNAIDNYMCQWIHEHKTYLNSDYFKKYFSAQLGPALSELVRRGINYKESET
jgi:hypothetical protein